MDSVLQTLPPASDLLPSVFSFLDDKFRTEENLSQARALVSELETQCRYLDQNLIDLNRSLGATLVAYASFSDRTHALFGDINARLIGLGSSTRSHTSTTADGGGGEGNERTEQILGEELPALAKEVARVETVRMYAGEFIKQLPF